MKKLIEWVIGVNVLSVLWLSLLFNQHNKIINEYYFIIQFFPIIAIIAFGVSTIKKQFCDVVLNDVNQFINRLSH